MNPTPNYLLEICCYSADDVLVAEAGGANRVELCNGIEVGGTTPTLGCIQLAKSLSTLPVFVMIRPRGGNFTYTNSEKKIMLKDAALAIENKADGIVFGALTAAGKIDEDFCNQFINLCKQVPITFHRAFDLCTDTASAIDFFIDIGIKTILTSGAQPTALLGINQLKKYHQVAQQRLQIMAGAGITANNILKFAEIGLTHFHSSASEIISTGNLIDKISFNASLKNNEGVQVSQRKVEAMIAQLNSFF